MISWILNEGEPTLSSKAERSLLLARLTTWAAERPNQVGFRELADGAPPREITYGELSRQVESTAQRIRSLARPGQRVALSLPAGVDFAIGFLGCIGAGTIGVPLQPHPSGKGGTEMSDDPLVRDSGAVLLLDRHGVTRLPAGSNQDPAADGEIAMLQYTSGSTGSPKGIMVTHDNLAHNAAAISRAMSVSTSDSGLIWLPPFHDMGLIGGIVVPLWSGFPVSLMSPMAFARDPLAWLRAISTERATLSGGPNFAYDACVKRSTPEQRAALDLSSWDVAFLGAEPVRAQTLRRFADAFAVAGFRPASFYPCYGLAESTLMVTGGRRGAGPVIAAGRQSPDGTAMAPALVGLGAPVGDGEVAVVEPSGLPAAEGAVGEIVVRGPSVASGYWRNPCAAALAFGSDGWLRTGDVGYLADGSLFISGRAKNMVIIRGRNVFPEDVEGAVAAAHPALAGCSVAAFGAEENGTEQLTVVVELPGRAMAADEAGELAADARTAVFRACGVQPGVVAIVRRGKLPRTTSGKLRRQLARESYLESRLDILAESRLPDPAAEAGGPVAAIADKPVGEAEFTPILESWLRSWCARSLGVGTDRITTDRPLIGAGLDSLGLAQLQADLSAHLGITVSLSELYSAESIAALAESCAAAPRTPPLPEAGQEPSAPAALGSAEATPQQAAVWFLEQRYPGTTMHHVARTFRVSGPVDLTALDAAVRLIVQRHAALRSRFTAQGGRVLITPGTVVIGLEVIDSAGYTEAEARDRAQVIMTRPFDLTTDQPLRTVIIPRQGEYLLVVVAHHAAVDLWTLAILMREIDSAYQALAAGHAPILPAVVASRGYQPTAAERAEELRAWWATEAAGGPEALALPVDLPRQSPPTLRTESVDAELAGTGISELSAVAVAAQASRTAVLLAALSTVLSSYSDGPQVTIGFMASGRTSPAARDLVGYQARPLPARIDTGGDPTFLELTRRVNQTVAAALDHDGLPFAEMARNKVAVLANGLNPLFPVLFQVHQRPPGTPPAFPAVALGVANASLTLGDLRLDVDHAINPDSIFDLTVEIAEADECTYLRLRYSAEIFEQATARTLLGLLCSVLRDATADPSQRCSQLVPARGSFGSQQGPRSADDDIVARIRSQAAATPDSVAVRQGSASISYGGLFTTSGRLAARLAELGVGPETCVAVSLPRTVELPMILLAVLRAGASYCPLDPRLPTARLSAIVEKIDPVLVITADGSTPGDVRAPVLGLADLGVSSLENLQATPDIGDGLVHPDQLGYLLFTSGSTGEPKGVSVSRRGIGALADWAAATYQPEDVASVLAGTALTFDMSVFELLVTLAVGGTMVIAGHALELPRIAERDHITLINTVPSVLHELLRHGLPPSVRAVNTGGEAVSVELMSDLKAVPQAMIINLYGPTEDTVFSTSARLDPAQRRLPSIGRPAHGSASVVVDRLGNPVGFGVPGELLVSGIKLARGYIGNPGLTADRFVPIAGGARAFRTLDIVRHRADGELIYVGRSDRQVKLRGVRMDLNGIEAVLSSHLAVREVAVQLHQPGELDAFLVAYVVGDATAVELRAHASALLGPAEVPQHYVSLDALPRLPSGKLDRMALQAPVPAGARPRPAGPQDSLEQEIAQIWATVLGVGAPDREENFFLAGGHSITALRVLGSLESRVGVPVQIDRFFIEPTIAGLARAVRETGLPLTTAAAPEDRGEAADPGRRPRAELPGAAPRHATYGPHPLGSSQEMFFLLQSLEPTSSAYHVAAVVRLRGDLDVPRLRRAMNAVAARHDSLRTIIRSEDGVPQQVVLPPTEVELPVTAAPDDQSAGRIAAVMADQPFDLSATPPWRVSLLRVTAQDHRLVFVAHHAICDGDSIELLAKELGETYSQDAVPGTPARSYVRWAAARRDRWAKVREAELAWWAERLTGLPELRLLTDHPRLEKGARPSASVQRTLPRGICGPLAEVARQESATTFMAATALVWAALAAQSGSERFGLAISVSNRADADDLFGCVVNAVVTRADLTGRPGFRGLVGKVRAETASALAHQETPLIEVAGAAFRGRADVHTRVMLSAQPALTSIAMEGLSAELTPLPAGSARCDLSIMIVPAPGSEMTVIFEYDAWLFDAATIDALADRFTRLAATAASDPDAPLAAVDLNSPQDSQLLDAWDDSGPVPGLPSDWLYGLVAAQARLTPDRIAIASARGSLSYAALIDRAERLAAGLIASGIRVEDRVAICHDRSPDMIVAVLGVLAAGGAYLPIRKADPPERRADMMRDAGARLVLCDEETVSWLDGWGVPAATLRDVISLARGGDRYAPRLIDPGQLAYVLYTSGSTGRPKGVAVSHQNVTPRLAWAQLTFADAERSGMLAATPLGFDISVLEIFMPLSSGGTVVLAEDILELATLAERERVTMLITVPSAAAAALEPGSLPRSLLTMGLGGEPLHAPLALRLREAGIERLLNIFGTTEEGICSIAAELPPEIGVITVGYPLPGSHAGVVDADGQRLPPGVPGELVSSGVGVSRGYLGRPALTAAAFRPDPAGAPGSRRYHTGDRGRWTPYGMEVHGRLDTQVKIRGHRVELGEIESALEAIGQVAAAAAIPTAREDSTAVTAFVRLRGETDEWDPVAFLASLRRRLPSYMIPAGVVRVDAMPYTKSGKIDRRALAEQATALMAVSRAADVTAPPRTRTERAVADAWTAVLGVPDVSANDRFFDIGGDSLLAARMVRELADSLDVALPVRLIFEEDRLASFAADIDALLGQEVTSLRVEATRAGESGQLDSHATADRLEVQREIAE